MPDRDREGPEEIDISDIEFRPRGKADPVQGAETIISQAIAGEYRYARAGLLLGAFLITGGVVLGLNGVVGSTSWTAKFLGLSSQLNDAAPGVFLFVVGIFLVYVTRLKIRLRNVR